MLNRREFLKLTGGLVALESLGGQIFPPYAQAGPIHLPEELPQLLEATLDGFEAMLDQVTGLPYDRSDALTLAPVAYSVSGTEAGLRILQLICARDLGVISSTQAEKALDRVLLSLEEMEKVTLSREVTGSSVTATLFYDFYIFEDSDLLPGSGIGLLDNGNLAAALAIATQAVEGTLAERAAALLRGMDFRFFLNPNGRTFRLGYDPETNSFEPYSLGQWGSEGILSVFLSIFKDGVDPMALELLLAASPPQEYTTPNGVTLRTIPGYAGGLWVKLFPLLFLGVAGVHPAILEDARRYVRVHIEKAKELGLPIWGWSPCSTLEGDYAEFGVPEIAQYGQPSTELVAPFASFLALGALGGFDPAQEEIGEALDNLRAISQLNPEAYDEQRGFVDVLDPRSGRIGPHLISLDKGMEVLALYNFLMRREGSAGVERYFWAYLEGLGQAADAHRLLNTIGEQMAQLIGSA